MKIIIYGDFPWFSMTFPINNGDFPWPLGPIGPPPPAQSRCERNHLQDGGAPVENSREPKRLKSGWILWLMVYRCYMGVSENVVYPIVPNGFADHYPVFKWLFHWEYTLFSYRWYITMVDGDYEQT